MSPYLRNDDMLWVVKLEKEKLYAGNLVFARRTETDEAVIHRILSDRSVKGDRTRQTDNELVGGVEVLGIVKGRFTARGSKLRLVSYDNAAVRVFHRIQAALSSWNTIQRPGVNRLSTLFLIILGWSARWIEDVMIGIKSKGIKNE